MIHKKLHELSKGEKSNWIDEAEYRIKNKKWLRYSSNIARRLLVAIKDRKGFNQAELARLLDISPQQVSKIVKGQENLTLQTIARLSEVMDTEFISFPDYKHTKPIEVAITYNTSATNTTTKETTKPPKKREYSPDFWCLTDIGVTVIEAKGTSLLGGEPKEKAKEYNYKSKDVYENCVS